MFVVLSVKDAGPFPCLVESSSRQDAVPVDPVVFLHIEIYGPVADVCISGIQDFLYESNLFDDMSRCNRLYGWRSHIHCFHCLVVTDGIFMGYLHRFELFEPCLFLYLVLSLICIVLEMSNISYVPDIAYLVSKMPEELDKNIVCHPRSSVSEVRISIDGRSADIQPHPARTDWNEQFLLPAQCVGYIKISHKNLTKFSRI